MLHGQSPWLKLGVALCQKSKPVGRGYNRRVNTIDGQLPPALLRGIDQLVQGVPIGRLRRASARLTDAYRRDAGRVSAMASTADRLAYIGARLPATFHATRSVLKNFSRCGLDSRVTSFLELGAGPAPGLWAAYEQFPSLLKATHVEQDHEMAELGRQLLRSTVIAQRIQSAWNGQPVPVSSDFGKHDVTLLAYLVGELDDDVRCQVLTSAWNSTRVALVVIEPGTPAGARRVLQARTWLVSQGGHVAAPCPHSVACPLPDEDWCHFSVRLNRSSLHRQLKGGTLAYEDEKYSYVVITRNAVARCQSRVLRHPQFTPRRVTLQLCSGDGLRTQQVTRGEGADYRRARKVRWGDAWETPAKPNEDGNRELKENVRDL